MAIKFTALVYGLSKSGKNSSIATLLKAGQKVRLLAADPNSEQGIRMGFELHKITTEQRKNFAAVDCSLGAATEAKKALKSLTDNTLTALRLSADAISKQPADPKKAEKKQLASMLAGLTRFVTAKGEDLGDVTEWGNDTTLVLDGLTALSHAVKQTIVGDQLTMSPGNYQAAQSMLRQYIHYLTNLNCNLVLLGHATQEKEEVTGIDRVFPLTDLGKAATNWLPGHFGELIYAERKQGNKFVWATSHPTALCGGSLLKDLRGDYPQDFAPIIAELNKLKELDTSIF